MGELVAKRYDFGKRFGIKLSGAELTQALSPYRWEVVIKKELQAASRRCSSNCTAANTLRVGTSKIRETMPSAALSPPSIL